MIKTTVHRDDDGDIELVKDEEDADDDDDERI